MDIGSSDTYLFPKFGGFVKGFVLQPHCPINGVIQEIEPAGDFLDFNPCALTEQMAIKCPADIVVFVSDTADAPSR